MVIFMGIAFLGMCLTARSSTCGAIPVTPSYIRYPLWRQAKGVHYLVRRQMRYDGR